MATDKYGAFVAELKLLCLRHDVLLATEGYDSLQVWDLKQGDDPLYGGEPDDRTKAEGGA